MNNEVQYVSPFKKLCITVGNLPTAYLESMSYYEGLTYLVNYLSNNVIPALNNNSQVVEELQQFVIDYFSDLNVQTQIDNKLDRMAEDGTLAEIINQEIFSGLDDRLTTEEGKTRDLEDRMTTEEGKTSGLEDRMTTEENKSASLQGQLQLSNIYTLDETKLSGDTEIIDHFSNGTICWNSDGSWFKCFLYMRVINDGTSKTIRIPFPQGFTVDSAYTINNAGEVWTSSGSFYGTVNLYVGTTEFVILLATSGTTYVKLNPYMYYNGVIESANE